MPNGNHGNRQGGRPEGGGYGGHGADVVATAPIPSPYNFVPLSEQVFFPTWTDQISMDVPFSDGISGTLQLKVTAKTPVYIRNGGVHPEREERLNDRTYTDFFRIHPDGPYAIPGTSIKGMLRAVVEIASFGKIVGGRTAPRVSDHRYAVRDLQNRQLYGNHITETVKGAYHPKVRAAWLEECGEDHDWQIQLCDFSRVEQQDLETWKGGRCFIGEGGPATEKYKIIQPNTTVQFDPGPLTPHAHSRGNMLLYQKAANLGSGATQGTIVLTGQPSTRDGRPGKKHMEFIFFGESTKVVKVPDTVKKDFIFAHSELGENRTPNREWAFWAGRMKRGERVPVFVLMDEKNPDQVSSMGLAMMYRLPYKHSIHQTIAHTGNEIHLDGSRLDLAELIFGRVEDQDGLRGRVAVETLLVDGNWTPMDEVTTVLNGPKPTYYPNYVKQAAGKNGNVNQYHTYMDEKAEIRGWKRYIVRPDSDAMPQTNRPPRKKDGTENLEVATRFRPLPADTTFIGTMHVHNLRPSELGALLWAIKWGGAKSLRHSLGMGKPYGFGSVVVEIQDADLRWCDPRKPEAVDQDACQKAFAATMEDFIPSWRESEQIHALKTMANPSMDWPQEVRYPRLGDGPRSNEFAQHKSRGNEHALVDPLAVKPRQPSHQSTAAPSKLDPVELSPTDRFLSELDSMSIGDISKRIKSLGDPANIPTETRKMIYQKMKKKPGAENWNVKQILEKWKP